MTIFGWDTSHYDGHLTVAVLKRAKAEGISFFTHKLGEAIGNVDPLAAEAFTSARAVGFPVIGGYWFIHRLEDPVLEANRCVLVADQVVPWWRDFGGWFWQTDAESVPGEGLPTAGQVKAFSDHLEESTGKRCVMYASAGMYGDRLAGLGHPLWNAHYGTNPVGGFEAVYPGDSSPGWAPYSGQTPALLQYGSNTTIAGLTTCDADAYRGTVDQLLTLINGGTPPPDQGVDMALTDADVDTILGRDKITNPSARPDSPLHSPAGANQYTGWGFAVGDTWDKVYDTLAAAASIQADVDALSAAVATLTAKVDALAEAVLTPPAAVSGDLEVTGTLHVTPAAS